MFKWVQKAHEHISTQVGQGVSMQYTQARKYANRPSKWAREHVSNT